MYEGFNQTHNLTRNGLVCQSKKAGKLPVFSSNWAQILCVCVCVCVLLSEIELLGNVEKVQAGEQRKGTSGGIGGVDVKQYELMIAALHL